MTSKTVPQITAGPDSTQYKHLAPKPGSNYRQLFAGGRIRAEVLYRETIGDEPLSPEQVAQEYGLPVEAVLESIDYCTHNKPLLDEERAASLRGSRRLGATSGRMHRAVVGRTDESVPG